MSEWGRKGWMKVRREGRREGRMKERREGGRDEWSEGERKGERKKEGGGKRRKTLIVHALRILITNDYECSFLCRR